MRRISKFALAAWIVLAWLAGGSTGHDKNAGMEASIHRADNLKWVDGPPALPPGAKLAVLEGDPTKAGPFVMRIKLPDGYKLPPHTHPKPERVTIIAGTFHLGMGDQFDKTKVTALPAGAYGTWPAGMKHFVWVKGETIVQFHGDGPWAINYVNPDDDPRNRKR
jgi:quercetin dioxygenase-like cupin family protein